MKDGKPQERTISNESYDDILHDALDREVQPHFGQERDTKSTGLGIEIFRTTWGKALIGLLVLNFALMMLSMQSGSDAISVKEARVALEKRYGSDARIFTAMDEMVTPQVDSPRELKERVTKLNDAFGEEVFDPSKFLFVGRTVVYTELHPSTP